MSTILVEWGYLGLFVASFLAGSILPFSSEVVLTILVQMGTDPVVCMVSATVGNSLGGMLCYWLGWLGNLKTIEKWLKIDSRRLDKMADKVKRHGAWVGFFGMLPWVGDVILVLLGLMKTNVWLTALYMTIGKLVRYMAILVALKGANSLLCM